jgi:2-amino-4-hydroxy-6-hydroxymethyldihydropteridine diphosphokinase
VTVGDAPASSRFTVAVEATEAEVGLARAGMAVLFSASTFEWTGLGDPSIAAGVTPPYALLVRDTHVDGEVVAAIAVETGAGAEHALDLARRRLDTLTVAQFCEEYSIELDLDQGGDEEDGDGGEEADTTVRAYVALGSNVGDRLAHLQAAVDGLAGAPGVTVAGVSRVYETAPVGGPSQDDYLNAVVALDTVAGSRDLLAIGQRLEAAEHRVRGERWGPRTLDVDVLLVGDEEVHEPDLEVPHPRMTERAFVLAPLADLDPAWASRVPADQACRPVPGLVLRVPE